MKTRLRILLAVLLLLLLCMASAETGSVSVRVHAGTTNIENAVIVLYRIGDAKIANANRIFEINADFAGSGETLRQISDKQLPEKLQNYAKTAHVPAVKMLETNGEGVVEFPALEEGAYLVCQQGFSKKRYFTEIDPFIITVPMPVDGSWVYSIETEPKSEPMPTPTPKPEPSPKPSDPKLPQTGLLRWPIFALAAGGIALFLLGWALCFSRDGKKRDHRA